MTESDNEFTTLICEKLDVSVKNCPCCESDNIKVGRMSFTGYGVQCLDCGLAMAMNIPNYYDVNVMGMSCDELTLRLAIMAWNRRPNEEI